MEIPPFFEKLIKEDHDLSSGVSSTVPKFEKWMSQSTLPFFPEYTDHNIKHIEEVLTTAYGLISDNAKPLLTSGDGTVLVLASLLHDCAMHLTEDGFFTLIDKGNGWLPIQPFDNCSWGDLWEDFMATARRFDERQLIAIFGDSISLPSPNLSKKVLHDEDRLLIGEFIRRNHPRLAHEIAIYGLPGIEGKSVQIVLNIEPKIADLAGLVARSHGMPLRECFGYLTDKFQLRDFGGIHAVYLMVLLRIADYLQIQPTRAPKEVLQVRKLRSPISQGEWSVHHSITNITKAGDDPEAISIDAEPPEAKIYLRIKDWIRGVQRELDDSWAVLGEVYGRYVPEGLSKLNLSLRRVRSNLDNWEEFSAKVDYVPAKVSFESANPDLLKLLVGPLYNEKPEVGIRELLQNSVDAVKELEFFLKRHPEHRAIERITQKEDVLITIESEDGEPEWVCIRDKGIGMSLDIIKNYFLKAGASFRKSKPWKKEFEDDDGYSQVLRAGRFGVGILAAFLLGDQLYIKTRHISQPKNRGLEFEAGLDIEMLNLKWVSLPVGTEIKIKISKSKRASVKNFLDYYDLGKGKISAEWDWYCLEKPVVKRKLLPFEKELVQANVVPLENSIPKKHWRTFCPPDFKKVHWTFHKAPSLVCNGLIVSRDSKRDGSYLGFSRKNYSSLLNFPKLSIFDPNANLPLNLQRTLLINNAIPFEDELATCLLDDFVAFALTKGPQQPIYLDTAAQLSFKGSKNVKDDISWDFDEKNIDPWIFGAKGYCLNNEFLFKKLKFSSILYIASSAGNINCFNFPKISDAMGVLSYKSNVDPKMERFSIESGLKFILGLKKTKGYLLKGPIGLNLEFTGRRVLLSKNIFNRVLGLGYISQAVQKTLTEAEREFENEKWVLLKIGHCHEEKCFNFKELIDNTNWGASLNSVYMFAEAFVGDGNVLKTPSSIVTDHWLKTVGNTLIPYVKGDREKTFPRLYKSLSKYIKLHENE